MSVDSFQRLLKTFGDATRLRMLALLEVEELDPELEMFLEEESGEE